MFLQEQAVTSVLVSFSTSCSSWRVTAPVGQVCIEGHWDSGWTVTRKAGHTYQCPRRKTQDAHFPSVPSQQIHLCHPNLNLSPVPNTHVHTAQLQTYPSPIITMALCVWPRKPWRVSVCTSSALSFQRGNDSCASYLELSTFNCTPPDTNSVQIITLITPKTCYGV